MKKFIAVICIMILILTCNVACQSNKSVQNQIYSYAPTAIQSFKPDTLSITQIDSVTRVDKLPKMIKWKQSSFKDAESNSTVLYRTLVDPNTNIIYTLKQLSGTKFVLFKKQIKSEN